MTSYDSAAALPARVRGRLRFTTDGAATWSAPRVAPSGLTTFVSPTEGMVFQVRSSSSLVVYHTTDAGQSWTVLDSLTGLPNLTRVQPQQLISAPSGQTAYIFSGDTLARRVIQVALGQHTWRVRPVPTAVGNTMFSTRQAIEFRTDSIGYVRDVSTGSPAPHRIFSTTNGGRTWTLAPGPSFGYGGVEFFAVGDTQHALAKASVAQFSPLLHTSNGGQTWTGTTMVDFTPAPEGPGNVFGPPNFGTFFYSGYPTQMLLRPSGVAWAVSEGGRIYYSTDFGATFAMRSKVLLVSRAAAIGFPDAAHGWVASKDDALLKTSDGGDNWTRVEVPGPATPAKEISTAAFPDADTIFVATNQLNARIYRSTDGGLTWQTATTPIPSGSTNIVRAMQFDGTARRGLAVGAFGMVRTTDGGLTWQAVTAGGGPDLNGIAWADRQTAFVTGTGTIRQSTDGGLTWQPLTTFPRPIGTAEVVRNISFVTPQLGFLTAADTLYRTTNGGQTWRKVPGATGGALAFGSPAFGLSLRQFTQDSGRTWQALPMQAAPGFLPAMADAENGFQAGATGQQEMTIVTRYLRRSLRMLPLTQTAFVAGDAVSARFITRGTFLPAERDFRIELSNPMGRFRPGQTTIIGQGTSSPLTGQLPATLRTGGHYRVRIIRADGSVISTDNGQDLLIQGIVTGLPTAAATGSPLRLYPNPAQQRVTVGFADGAQPGRQLRLLDLTGRSLLTMPAAGTDVSVKLTGLVPGCYLIEALLPNGQRTTQRLVVQP